MLRCITTWLVLSITVALVEGCGKTGPAVTSSASAPVTATQAAAYAHAVNLRAADVPGMASQRNAEVVVYPRRRGPGPFLRCARIPAAELLLEVHSTIFNAPYWWMRSTVAVLPSEALAAAYVSALGSSRGRRCLFAGFPSRVHMTVDTLVAPARIVAFRVTQNTGVPQPTHTDVFAFASGRALVTLTAQGEKTPPLTIERRLASLLYSRAMAHKL